ncbi:MAG: hypothetical protein ACLGI6_21725 [Gammaproteobacteria bacterium]
MKNLFTRASLLLACALSVSACGGGNANLQLGVNVTGLTKEGLVLKNVSNGDTLAISRAAAASGYPLPFNKLLEPDEHFDVEIDATPSGTTCTLQNNKGRIGAYSLSNIYVTCTNIPRELSGTVTGLKGSGLVLNNGSQRLAIEPTGASPQSFTFATRDSAGKITGGTVGQGDPFGVTVLTQPTGQTCTVTNGTGIMGEGYSAVAVSCQ